MTCLFPSVLDFDAAVLHELRCIVLLACGIVDAFLRVFVGDLFEVDDEGDFVSVDVDVDGFVVWLTAANT